MNSARIVLVVLFTSTASFSNSASAAPVTVPPNLSAGAQYRLAFVSSTTIDATSPSITTYNNMIANVAGSIPELAALGTSWNAIASTSSIAARDNTGTNPNLSTGVPIYRLDGTRIADNNADLWDGFLLATLQTLENGVIAPGVAVWTGTDTNGTEFTNGIFGPPAGLGTLPQPVLGASNSFFPSWIVSSTVPPAELHPLFGMSGILTVVPEPASVFLILSGAAIGIASRRRLAV